VGDLPSDAGAQLASSIAVSLINNNVIPVAYGTPPNVVPVLVVSEVGLTGGGFDQITVGAYDPTTGDFIDILLGWGFTFTVI
jgi:hypothetical protein